MAFDLDMIKGVYARMQGRVEAARKIEGRPLTLAEKILYSQSWNGVPTRADKRKSYVDFSLICAARQHAGAHMAFV